MENLARRGFLKALVGVGVAVACGVKAGDVMAESAVKAGADAVPATDAAVTEAVESGMEPNQFYIVRRRRWRPRRRVVYFRPRRRRVFIVRRRRRFRRW